jgi:hypothetical protein
MNVTTPISEDALVPHVVGVDRDELDRPEVAARRRHQPRLAGPRTCGGADAVAAIAAHLGLRAELALP